MRISSFKVKSDLRREIRPTVEIGEMRSDYRDLREMTMESVADEWTVEWRRLVGEKGAAAEVGWGKWRLKVEREVKKGPKGKGGGGGRGGGGLAV